MRRYLPLVLTALGACTISVRPGDSRASLEESGALRFALYEYERDGLRHVWIPTWHGGGVLGISSSLAAPDLDRSVLSFKDGELVAVEDLGAERARWIERLRRDRADFGAEDNDFVARGRVAEGMAVPAVLLSWGPPNGEQGSSPRWYRPRREISAGSDEVLWYSWREGRSGRSLAWTLLTIKDGRVASIESEGPGVPDVPTRKTPPAPPPPELGSR